MAGDSIVAPCNGHAPTSNKRSHDTPEFSPAAKRSKPSASTAQGRSSNWTKKENRNRNRNRKRQLSENQLNPPTPSTQQSGGMAAKQPATQNYITEDRPNMQVPLHRNSRGGRRRTAKSMHQAGCRPQLQHNPSGPHARSDRPAPSEAGPGQTASNTAVACDNLVAGNMVQRPAHDQQQQAVVQRLRQLQDCAESMRTILEGNFDLDNLLTMDITQLRLLLVNIHGAAFKVMHLTSKHLRRIEEVPLSVLHGPKDTSGPRPQGTTQGDPASAQQQQSTPLAEKSNRQADHVTDVANGAHAAANLATKPNSSQPAAKVEASASRPKQSRKPAVASPQMLNGQPPPALHSQISRESTGQHQQSSNAGARADAGRSKQGVAGRPGVAGTAQQQNAQTPTAGEAAGVVQPGMAPSQGVPMGMHAPAPCSNGTGAAAQQADCGGEHGSSSNHSRSSSSHSSSSDSDASAASSSSYTSSSGSNDSSSDDEDENEDDAGGRAANQVDQHFNAAGMEEPVITQQQKHQQQKHCRQQHHQQQQQQQQQQAATTQPLQSPAEQQPEGQHPVQQPEQLTCCVCQSVVGNERLLQHSVYYRACDTCLQLAGKRCFVLSHCPRTNCHATNIKLGQTGWHHSGTALRPHFIYLTKTGVFGTRYEKDRKKVSKPRQQKANGGAVD
eukprot:jgi/Chrzof1/3898/Cz13g12170.t1